MFKNLNPKYLKAAVYGANDGIVTTFAVVAGVSGAHLSSKIVLILGIGTMIADAMSMAVGDYLGEKSEQQLRKAQQKSYKGCCLWKTGLVTFVSFVGSGVLPLMPFILKTVGLPIADEKQFLLSIFSTGAALFFVGSMRTILTKGSWLKNGLEMLGIGAMAATAAYLLGAFIEQLV